MALSAALACAAQTPVSLDLGYRQMYNLQFEQARRTFTAFEQAHPDDPMGPVSEAAAYLFSEFNRLRILESQFFVDDESFRHPVKLEPDPAVRRAFDDALARAARLTQARPADLAAVLAAGLRSDYLGLIERRYMASLHEMQRGRELAQQLLRRDPARYDAYIALGAENYILSQKPTPVRWFLNMNGAHTDKQEGLRELRMTAEHGQYLAPFARLLLAVAALRDQDRGRARDLLAGLASDFPGNPLYRRELAKLSNS